MFMVSNQQESSTEVSPEASVSVSEDSSKSQKKKLRIILLIVCGVVVLACGIYLLSGGLNALQSRRAKDELSQVAKVNNLVDFKALQKKNEDIVGWITIPQTKVDYPVLRSATDDFFYLTHDETKAISVYGSIFMEMANKADFSDPVTVLYGHNMIDEEMFATLHYFENPEFFAANEEMTICIPGHILTYQIIAASINDDRHILNSYDFNKGEELEAYFQSVLNPVSLVANVREGASLSKDDKIVQLSTCMSEWNLGNQRLIVTGVLVNDQPTY